MRLIRKIIALMLVMTMIMTLQGGIFFTVADNIVKAVDNADEVDFPIFIPEDAVDRDKHVKRLKEDEDKYTAIYENEDGTISVYSFGSPIKYKDSNGKLVDYDPRLKEVKNNEKKNAGYAYELTSSDVSVMLPQDIATNKYITLEKDKYKIDFKPLTDLSKDKGEEYKAEDKYKPKEIMEKDNIAGLEYLSADSDNITYKYYSTNTGVKEDIVLKSAPETNILQFELKVKDLIPVLSEGGQIIFQDEETQEQVGNMSPLFMFDSIMIEYDEDEIHFSDDIQMEIEQDGNNKNKYILTVHLDEEMLYSENTVYPVTVDPSITFKSTTTDTYLRSDAYLNYAGSSYLISGKYSTFVYRSYIKFSLPSTYDPYSITSARYYIKCNEEEWFKDYRSVQELYRLTSYSNLNSVSWFSVSGYDTTRISYALVYGMGTYSFDIKNMVQEWADYSMSDGQDGYPNYGFMIKASDESDYKRRRYFGSQNNPYYTPYAVVTYKQDNEAPNNVAWLTGVASEDPVNNGKATIEFDWPETTDNSSGDPEGVKEYELTLTDAAGNFYNADGAMTDAATPENYSPEIIPHMDPIIIDNTDTEFSTSGTWSTSSGVAGYYGSDYRYARNDDGTVTGNTATWTPNITIPGDYNVYMRWTVHENRPDAAPVEIKYNGGTDTSKTVNQTQNNGEWVLLGTYNLSVGTGNYVKKIGDDVGCTVADAVKFEYNTAASIKEFVNLPDNTTYYGKIRACDDMPIGDWTAPHWSGFTYSGSIVIGDIPEVVLTSIMPSDWADDQTPTIAWTGVAAASEVEYSIDEGAWTDSGLLGSAGSGDLPSLGFTADGQYQIQIRGMDTATSTPTAECSPLTYKFDMTAPSVDISSPLDGATIGESMDILGSVLDDASGIASWTLEYNDGVEPITWNTIATGMDTVNQGQTLAVWDTSALGVGNYTVRLTATDNVGHNSLEEEIALVKPIAYTLTTPIALMATAYTNYKMTVDWEDGINPSGTTYDIYRDSTDTFTPDATNLIAEDLANTYWYDYDVTSGNSYYYKVIAVYDVGGGMMEYSVSTAASNEGTITAPSEVTDKLGMQDFWKFAGFSAGNGAGYINVANGNLVYSSTDSVFPGYMLAMVMRRTYNSQSDVKTTLGYGWDFSYNTRLFKEIDGADEDIILKDGDGSLHYFQYTSTASGIRTYDAPDGVFMELTYEEAADEYTIVRKDYVTYVFNGDLEIVKLSELNGNYLAFSYDQGGRLNSVENCDTNDNSINQAYLSYYQSSDSGAAYYTADTAHTGLLAQMTDEANRAYKYEYVAGSAQLEKAYYDIAGTANDYVEEYTYATATNNLASIEDAIGHITSVTYLAGGKVNTVTYPDSKYFTCAYVTGVSKTLFDGTTQLTLDTTTVEDSWEHTTEYAYNSSSLVRVITNTLGDSSEYDYNNELQVTAVRHQNYVGAATTLSTIETTIGYNADSNITSITDPDGHITSFTYDTVFTNKVKTVTVPMNASVSSTTVNTYKTDGNLDYTTDAKDNVTAYTYTNTGLIESVINYVGSASSSLGSKTEYTYGGDGWLNEVRQGDKNDTTLAVMSKVISYDAAGNPTIIEDAMGNQTKVEYDALGRPTKTYLPDRDTQESTQNWTNNEYTTAAYDLKGNITGAMDIMGLVTDFAYDSMDRLISTTLNASSGDIVSTLSYADYALNSTTCLKVTATNPEGVQGIEYYDELGRVMQTAVSNSTTEIVRGIAEYDKAGNVVLSKDIIESTTEYRETTYEYDKLNRQTKAKMYNDASELVATTTAYDYVGNVSQVTDPQGYHTFYYYDQIGRLTTVNAGGYNTNYHYDNIEDCGGVDYLMNYISDPKGHRKETYLDAYGNPVVEIDQGDINTTNINRVVQRTFNLNGTVDTATQADGQVDCFEYNNWGQTTLARYSSAISIDNQTVYTYKDYGSIDTMTDSRTNTVAGGVVTVVTGWSYDEIGRASSVTQDGTTIQYEYDDASNLIKIKQPTSDSSTSTEITEYIYNGYGQVGSVYQGSDNGSTIISEKIRDYNYHTSGQLDNVVDYLKFDEGDTTTTMTTEYDYTALGQLKELKYINDSTSATMEKYTYTYDKRGNILTEYIYNTHGGTTSYTKSYVYDSLSRLKKTTVGTDVTDYTYDSTNNRNSEISRQTNDFYDKYLYYNEFDQLDYVTLNISNGAQNVEEYDYNARGAVTHLWTDTYNSYDLIGYEDGTTIISYDEYGNPEYEQIPVYGWLGSTQLNADYTYDKAGMLQKSVQELEENGPTETTGHFYNGMEQRVRKIVDSTTTKYIYSGRELLFTTDGNNAKLTENILAPSGQVIASQRFEGSYAGNYYFYNQDIRNSTMSIISNSYTPIKYYSYNEYGKQTAYGNASFINSETYTGSVTEGGNVFYMMARFYDANNGRFLTQDTYKGNAWEPMSHNLYSYVGNNPINYVDPTGHRRIENTKSTQLRDQDWNMRFENRGSIIADLESMSTTRGVNRFLDVAQQELEALHIHGLMDGRIEVENNNTMYNHWYDHYDESNGSGYWVGRDWCVMFVNYCAYEAGILHDIVFEETGVGNMWSLYYADGRFKHQGYFPKEGDVMFISNNGNNHITIVQAFDPKTGNVFTIEGNLGDGVNYAVRNIGDGNIYGFGANGGTSVGIIPSYSFHPALVSDLAN